MKVSPQTENTKLTDQKFRKHDILWSWKKQAKTETSPTPHFNVYLQQGFSRKLGQMVVTWKGFM